MEGENSATVFITGFKLNPTTTLKGLALLRLVCDKIMGILLIEIGIPKRKYNINWQDQIGNLITKSQ